MSQLLRFEDMMSDYETFKSDLLDILEVDISEESWARYVNRPRNVSRKYNFDHWNQWDKG